MASLVSSSSSVLFHNSKIENNGFSSYYSRNQQRSISFLNNSHPSSKLVLRKHVQPIIKVSYSSSEAFPSNSSSIPTTNTSTRLITSIFATGVSISTLFLQQQAIQFQRCMGMGGGSGSLFFASLRVRPRGYLNTPFTAVAFGMAKMA
ncbi:hypothetical protein FRX31_016432 [Thalictrum thalictroides]|uniref:Uncharacterized protein n=1 Tax=Thalictrum thalictroides TaxID=46969 RepID=A0A7J6W9K5_THATH|nr:hypothetical protein FRX31_016432 [Thalictrum thalictroides]